MTGRWLRVDVPGEYCSGNVATRTYNGRQYKPTKIAGYQARVYSHALEAALKAKWSIPYYAWVDIELYNGRIDRDNAAKVILDGIQGVIVSHDSRILNGCITKLKDDEGPRIVLWARQIDDFESKNGYGYIVPKESRVVAGTTLGCTRFTGSSTIEALLS